MQRITKITTANNKMGKKINLEASATKAVQLGILLGHDHLRDNFAVGNIEDVPFSSNTYKTISTADDASKKYPMSITKEAKMMLSKFIKMFSRGITLDDEECTPRKLARMMRQKLEVSNMWGESFRVYRGIDMELVACLELDNTRKESVNAITHAQALADFLKGVGVMASILNFSKPQALSATTLRAVLRMHMFGSMPIDEEFMDTLLDPIEPPS